MSENNEKTEKKTAKKKAASKKAKMKLLKLYETTHKELLDYVKDNNEELYKKIESDINKVKEENKKKGELLKKAREEKLKEEAFGWGFEDSEEKGKDEESE